MAFFFFFFFSTISFLVGLFIFFNSPYYSLEGYEWLENMGANNIYLLLIPNLFFLLSFLIHYSVLKFITHTIAGMWNICILKIIYYSTSFKDVIFSRWGISLRRHWDNDERLAFLQYLLERKNWGAKYQLSVSYDELCHIVDKYDTLVGCEQALDNLFKEKIKELNLVLQKSSSVLSIIEEGVKETCFFIYTHPFFSVGVLLTFIIGSVVFFSSTSSLPGDEVNQLKDKIEILRQSVGGLDKNFDFLSHEKYPLLIQKVESLRNSILSLNGQIPDQNLMTGLNFLIDQLGVPLPETQSYELWEALVKLAKEHSSRFPGPGHRLI